MNNYALKVNTEFSNEEIKKSINIVNCDEAKDYEILENNFEGSLNDNKFISHTIINLNKEGASVKFIGRYDSKKNLVDVSCTVNHNVSNTNSEINIRGISRDQGKIISRSDIVVKENLSGIIGKEKADFLFVVNEDGKAGEIDAIPYLNINSKDVSIKHSLSISKIKEADIWYASLHGLDEKEAKDSFVKSFLL